jgi:hypothetical protein
MMKELILNPNNPREIKKDVFEKLKRSLLDFPQMLDIRPIVYDEKNIILGGNMRYKALQELDREGFEVKDTWFKNVTDLTEKQKKEFVIKDNVAFGEWDYDALANEWSDLPLEEWGINTDAWGATIIDDMSLEDKDHEFTQMTFTLSMRQKDIVDSAIKKARKGVEISDNQNGNGNALEVVCNGYLG